jgi:hypothetical protein
MANYCRAVIKSPRGTGWMHLKVFLKLKNPKNSLSWENLSKKNKKKTKKSKKSTGLSFFLNPGFYQSCLGGQQALLHIPPAHRVQLSVADLEGGVEEGLDLPELEAVHDDNDDAGGPEGDGDEHEGLGEQGHVGERAQLKDLGKMQLFPLVLRRQFILRKKGKVSRDWFFEKNYKK